MRHRVQGTLQMTEKKEKEKRKRRKKKKRKTQWKYVTINTIQYDYVD